MNKRKIMDKEINFILEQVEKGASVKDVCYMMGISQTKFYSLRKKYSFTTELSCSKKAMLERENEQLRKIIEGLERDKKDIIFELTSKRMKK